MFILFAWELGRAVGAEFRSALGERLFHPGEGPGVAWILGEVDVFVRIGDGVVELLAAVRPFEVSEFAGVEATSQISRATIDHSVNRLLAG